MESIDQIIPAMVAPGLSGKVVKSVHIRTGLPSKPGIKEDEENYIEAGCRRHQAGNHRLPATHAKSQCIMDGEVNGEREDGSSENWMDQERDEAGARRLKGQFGQCPLARWHLRRGRDFNRHEA